MDDKLPSDSPVITTSSNVTQSQASATPSPTINTPEISTPKTSKKLLFVVLSLVAVIAIGSILALLLKPTTKNDYEDQKVEVMPVISKIPTTVKRQDVSTLNYKKKTIAFGQPVIPEWKNTIFGQEGIYQYKMKTNTCQITLQQEKGAEAAGAAGQSIDSNIKRYYDDTKAALKNETMKYGPIAKSTIDTNQNSKIDLIRYQGTYSSSEGSEYTLQIGGQWVGDYQFLIISACSTSDWGKYQTEIQNFLDKTKLIIHETY